jgi:hypothetical protein
MPSNAEVGSLPIAPHPPTPHPWASSPHCQLCEVLYCLSHHIFTIWEIGKRNNQLIK